MIKRVLGVLWRVAPRGLRRMGARLWQTRFTISAGAVVLDEQGRILLLKHVFRTGTGWGVPGGFVSAGEQPEEAVRRELREETGLEVLSEELIFTRMHTHVKHFELIFRCRSRGQAAARSLEIKALDWFALDALPADLSRDQRQLIERALGDGAKQRT